MTSHRYVGWLDSDGAEEVCYVCRQPQATCGDFIDLIDCADCGTMIVLGAEHECGGRARMALAVGE